jgi:bifunctional UDP-N-acetylglucosamine pyrophosphorylase/glucosamine-1-phosphate N-acetyltransferase
MNNLVVTILTCVDEQHSRYDLQLYNEKPILAKMIETIRELNPKKILVVTGKFHSNIIQALAKYIDIFGIIFVNQPEDMGAGDAIKYCLGEYETDDKVLIMNSDTPLITSSILQNFISGSRGSCNVLTSQLENPFGYGRIIHDKDGDFIKIVEEHDCSDSQRKINIINTGIFFINGFILKQFVPFITNNNSKRKCYVTDIIKIVISKSWNVVNTFLLDKSETKQILNVKSLEEV